MADRNHPHYPTWVDEQHRSEKIIDTTNALYAIPKAVRRRVIAEGRQRFVAFDAHQLLTEGEGGRPGHLFD